MIGIHLRWEPRAGVSQLLTSLIHIVIRSAQLRSPLRSVPISALRLPYLRGMPMRALLFLNIWISCLYNTPTHLPYEGTFSLSTLPTCPTQLLPFYPDTCPTQTLTNFYLPTVVVSSPQENAPALSYPYPHTKTRNKKK